jgi:hypothetical protein
VTGLSIQSTELAGRFKILREALSHLRRVVTIGDVDLSRLGARDLMQLLAARRRKVLG